MPRPYLNPKAGWVLLVSLGLSTPFYAAAYGQSANGGGDATSKIQLISTGGFANPGADESEMATIATPKAARKSRRSAANLMSASDPYQRALRSTTEPTDFEFVTVQATETSPDVQLTPQEGGYEQTAGYGDSGYQAPGIFGIAPPGSLMVSAPAGQSGPRPPNAPPADMPPRPESHPLVASFGTSGFQLQSPDKQFTLQFHNLTQLDFRAYSHTATDKIPAPAGSPGGPRDEFTIPRQWLLFNGTLGKNWEWFASTAFGFDNVNLLDTFLNAHYDDRVQVKVGRYKTPFTYEFYSMPIQGLIQPERSLFFNNFGLNRSDGAMVHGTVFDQYADYAIGAFNGQRNGFVANTNAKDVAGFLNVRPFMNSDYCALRRIDIGGSFDIGDQQNPYSSSAAPTALRTNVATNGNLVNGVEFLNFKTTVFESGQRAFGSLHAAYFYNQLSLISEYQGGTQGYANSATGTNLRVPVKSWYIQGGYFLTGETTNYRNTVTPLNNFNPFNGCLGAIELTSRFNYINVNNKVFGAGYVDTTAGNQWTTRVAMTDVGVNWYPNTWVKYSMTWEHAQFGSNVTYQVGRASTYNDMFWTRMQVWF